MVKSLLIKHIEALYKTNNEVVLSLEDFFEDRDDKGSFAADFYENDFGAAQFYSAFKDLRSKNEVQDVLIQVFDYDDPIEGPYGDTAIVITSLNESVLVDYMGEQCPTEIAELADTDELRTYLPETDDGMRVIALWWE